MMLCPLNVVLKLNRFVNVTCSFNITGEYFEAQYFSIPLACPLPSITQCLYPLLNKQLKDCSRTHFPFFKDSIQCKKEPRVYSFFSSSTTWVILLRRSFCVCSFFFGVQLNYKISTEIQGPSGTDCNFQGLSWP